jgi:hypothetical protein
MRSGSSGAKPSCVWVVNARILGIVTTSLLSRLNSENTASMPPLRRAKSRMKGVVALTEATMLFVATSRSAPSAWP